LEFIGSGNTRKYTPISKCGSERVKLICSSLAAFPTTCAKMRVH
jgi:hypothetical protein